MRINDASEFLSERQKGMDSSGRRGSCRRNFFALAFQFVQSISYADSDFFSFWYAGHSVLTGNDPYNESYWVNERSQFGAVWVSDATFLYPLPLAVLLVPLGLFPLLWAYTLWVALSLVLALLSGLMILSVRGGLQRKRMPFPSCSPFRCFGPCWSPFITARLARHCFSRWPYLFYCGNEGFGFWAESHWRSWPLNRASDYHSWF